MKSVCLVLGVARSRICMCGTTGAATGRTAAVTARWPRMRDCWPICDVTLPTCPAMAIAGLARCSIESDVRKVKRR